jgi:hypothetical protein
LDKKFFVIIIIVLVLNFVIGSTGVVLAAVSLAKQSNMAGPATIARNMTPGSNITHGQAGNYQTQMQPNPYGVGGQSSIPQTGGQQAARPQWNNQAGGHRFGGHRYGGHRCGGHRFGGHRFGGHRFGGHRSD